MRNSNPITNLLFVALLGAVAPIAGCDGGAPLDDAGDGDASGDGDGDTVGDGDGNGDTVGDSDGDGDGDDCSAPGVVCAGECGDGAADTGEVCDGDDLRGASCLTEGFASGTLSCTDDCVLDTSGCDDAVSACAGLLCLNGGACVASGDTASCLCPDGFEGPTCETPSVPPTCATLVCANGGVCGLPFDDDAADTCECSPYWSGATCETAGPTTPYFDGDPIEFWYRWQAADTTPEVETLPEAVPPPVVDLGGDVVTLPVGSVAQQLYDTYAIVLDDALLPWDNASATALLKTIERFPSLPPPSEDVYRVRRTADALTDDVVVAPTSAAPYVLITFASAAFTLANPIEQPAHDGVERVFYSNRLYRACVRAFFPTVPDLEGLLLERYGVEVRDGVPKDDFQRFTYDELVTILSTFEDFPPGFRQLPNLRFMTRRKNGLVNPYHPTAPAIAWVSANEIEFMESAFTTTSLDYLHRLVAHELSHFVYALLDVVDVQTWSGLSEWVEIGDDVWSHGTFTNFVSDYSAALNPNEDFAESVSFYIYDPDWVRTIAPGKYAFIRDILDGYEYVLLIDEDVVFSVFNLYPDDTFPGRIVRVTNTVTLGPDGVHHAHMELRLHQPPFESDTLAYARLWSPSGSQFRDVYFYPQGDGTRLVGELDFGPYDEDGYWRPGDITVEEWGGNTVHQGQTSYGWLLWFDNAEADLDPPTTVLDAVSGSAVKVGDEWSVTVSAPAHDMQAQDIVGYAELLHYESGQKVSKYGVYDQGTGVMTWTFIVRPYHASGTWTFRTFRLIDASGNEEIYDLNDGPGPLTFNVTTATPDLEPPELDLESPSASATPVNPAAPDGETDVWLTYRSRDNLAGLGVVSFRLKKPSGATLFDYHVHDEFFAPYYTGDPTAWTERTIHIHLPVGSEAGTWGWMELTLCDKAGNCQEYSFTEIGIVATVE